MWFVKIVELHVLWHSQPSLHEIGIISNFHHVPITSKAQSTTTYHVQCTEDQGGELATPDVFKLDADSNSCLQFELFIISRHNDVTLVNDAMQALLS